VDWLDHEAGKGWKAAQETGVFHFLHATAQKFSLHKNCDPAVAHAPITKSKSDRTPANSAVLGFLYPAEVKHTDHIAYMDW
jgi:hypothetical protein